MGGHQQSYLIEMEKPTFPYMITPNALIRYLQNTESDDELEVPENQAQEHPQEHERSPHHNNETDDDDHKEDDIRDGDLGVFSNIRVCFGL